MEHVCVLFEHQMLGGQLISLGTSHLFVWGRDVMHTLFSNL